MNLHPRRHAEASGFQNAWPEQSVEVNNVLPNEMVDLGIVTLPPIFQLLVVGVAPLLRRTDVANRGIKPDVPIIAGRVGDLETEVRGWPGNVPIPKLLLAFVRFLIAQKMAFQIIGDFWLKCIPTLDPLFEEIMKLL